VHRERLPRRVLTASADFASFVRLTTREEGTIGNGVPTANMKGESASQGMADDQLETGIE
jgi:hypothetical protein